MARKLTEFDPVDGIVTSYEHDEMTDVLITTRTQDVEPILEENKARRNHGIVGKDWRHAASIPNIIIEKWIKEKGVNVFNKDHMPKVKQLLNDPEWAYLRTWPGKL